MNNNVVLVKFQIEVMMYGSIYIEIERKEEVKILVNVSDETGLGTENEYSFPIIRFEKFEKQITEIIKNLEFEDNICELYDKDDSLNWILELSDGNQINSSEKNELMYSIIRCIEKCFPIRKKISRFIDF